MSESQAPKKQHSSRLGLKIPERQSAPDSFLQDPKATDAWFDALPIANVGETARQVYKCLHEFNRIDVPDVLRAKTVEKFRSPIHLLTGSLERHYLDARFPLRQRPRKVAMLCRELFSEMATSYKVIIEHMLSDNGGHFDRDLLIIAIGRALYYLGRVIFQSAIIYEPYPAGIWREIHSLFAYASQNRVDKVPIKDRIDDSERELTITGLYKQVLLFAIASPYQMRQRDIGILDKQLDSWAQQARLSAPDSDLAETDYRFVVGIWSDAPPTHLSLYPEPPNQRCVQLSTRALVEHLRAEGGDSSESESSLNVYPRVNQSMKRLLIRNWTQAPQRDYVRTRLHFELRIAVGLKAISELMQERPKPTAPAAPPPSKTLDHSWLDKSSFGGADSPYMADPLTAIPTDGLQLTPQAPKNQPDSIFADSHQSTSIDGSDWASASKSQDDGAKTQSFSTVNESAGGYCINWEGQDIPGVKVGELIGIQSASDARHFGLGIARWLKNVPGSSLLVGMQILSSNCVPVDVRLAARLPAKKQPAPSRGLLVPDPSYGEPEPSLLLSPDAFNLGDRLWLNDTHTSERSIKLLEILESTGSFNRYRFEWETEHPATDDDAGDRGENDFDNLWSNL